MRQIVLFMMIFFSTTFGYSQQKSSRAINLRGEYQKNPKGIDAALSKALKSIKESIE